MVESDSALRAATSTKPAPAPAPTGNAEPASLGRRPGPTAEGLKPRIPEWCHDLAQRTWLVDVLAIVALALLMRLIFPHAEPETDPTYALIWGRDIVHGHLPDFAFPSGPTAHPLPTLEATLAVLLGRDGAVTATMVASYACLGAVLWGTFRLAETLFSWREALLAMIIVGTNVATVDVGLGAFLDVQFVALLVWAAVMEVRRPRRGFSVLALLVAAGTLRPEAWLLAGVYCLYAFRGRRRLVAGLAVLCAPLAWVVMDMIVTGNPLFAFTNAQQSSEAVALGQSTNQGLISFALSLLRNAMRAPVLLGGTLGFLLALRLRPRAIAFPGALFVLLLAVFASFILLHLPVPNRMLLTPAVLFAVFCAFAALGWLRHPKRSEHRLWAIGAVGIIAVLVATAPREMSRLQNLDQRRTVIQQAMTDLVALGRAPAAQASLASCRVLSVGASSLVPYTAYYLNRPLQRMQLVTTGTPSGGAYLALASRATSLAVLGFMPDAGTRVPRGFRVMSGNRSWRLYTRGC